MIDFTQLLDRIEKLLKSGVGDTSRLEHIKKSILENKKLYNSDIQYVEEMERKRQIDITDEANTHAKGDDISCWKCGKEILQDSKFCSFCGIEQSQGNSEFDSVLSRRIKREYNPIKIILNFHWYQILAVIGGLAAIVPILFAILNMERLLEIIEFYTNNDLSKFSRGFMALGSVAGVLSAFIMLVPFWIKKPKKVGKILFFSSFGILALSVIVGAVGFLIILTAGILALKKRRY